MNPRNVVARPVHGGLEWSAGEGLDAVRLSAWRAVSSVRDAVYDDLNGKMRSLASIPVEWYEILLHLKEAGNGRLRQTAIEELATIGSSGVSRVVFTPCSAAGSTMTRREP